MRARVTVVVAAIVAVAVALSAAPPTPKPQAPTSGIDAVFSAFDRKDSPGCALGVFKNGAIAYERGYGMASLEHDIPITPRSVFYAGSVSKQFTAMSAALAIQLGMLGYDDPIRKYLPELPAYADAIRVRHLVHHTSGLRDYNTLLSVAGRRDEDAWDNRAVLQITARQTGLNFPPGDEYLYSNTGYTLLATIVERATRTPFAAFADAHIFTPLGMTSTHYHVDARRLVPGRALAFAERDGRWLLATPINERAGAGGVYTSIPDLLKWDENFYTGKVGGADLLKKLQTPGNLNAGQPLRYAWGLQIGEYRGLPIVEHGGSLGGYRAHLVRFPTEHTSVALLCNASSIVGAGLARRVADVVIGERFTKPVPPPPPGGTPGSAPGQTPTPIPADLQREYAGTYYSEELQTAFTVTAGPRAPLLARDTDPVPVELARGNAADEFRRAGFTIRFDRDASKKVTGLTVDAGRVRGIKFTKR
jgi:CubicO group peptidase (beta-lactamase class C family)